MAKKNTALTNASLTLKDCETKGLGDLEIWCTEWKKRKSWVVHEPMSLVKVSIMSQK